MTEADIRDESPGETSSNSLDDVVRSQDGFVNLEPTEIVSGDENHTASNGHWKTMVDVPVDHESPETATGDESRDTSSDSRGWETVPAEVRSPDPPMNDPVQTEWTEENAEEPNREVSLPETTHVLPYSVPPMMYAPAYHDPNLFTPSSHNMILPHNPYHHGYPAPAPPFPHFRPAPVQLRASMTPNASPNADPCQQHFTYGHCPVGPACIFRSALLIQGV